MKADTVQKMVLGAALLAALVWNLAQAAEVRGVQLDRGPTGTRAEVALDAAAADYRVIRLSAPERLVVDLPASSIRRGAPLPSPTGVVRSVRYGAPAPGVARIVFDLAQPVAALQPRIEPAGAGARLVLEWPGDDEPVAVAAAPTASVPSPTVLQPPSTPPGTAIERPSIDAVIASVAGSSQAAPAVTTTPVLPPQSSAPAIVAPPRIEASAATTASSAPVLLPAPAAPRVASGRPPRARVIAIDAGHGGQDPGAHGPSGRREKDVTLAIARELARQVNATPGYKAYLTRDSDFFIPLNERARLAKRAGADMFVSIHADAAENPAARGSSVFVLSLKGASSQRARWLADKENAADLIGGVRVEPSNTLASVLLDLTQSGNLKASEDVAGQVLSGLARLGPNHKSTVERANFAVLRTSDTPAMLVETAFISNPEEEQRLSDPAQQSAIARAVFGGINSYFLRTPPPGTLLAARAEDSVIAGSGRAGGSR
ncbi:N-acetylmuramoyl-L-alanine amidase [Cognatilysobacter segetis]|uniref:N-acetylmuramoyl-L-alanine amidase n=2 Tax=Cognatilysobacter segetis TaxID=2492394 RepID=UPI001EE4DA71|nr:N-acetylmuramoyl-L-alanine amidase [Lysobacter segetis]